MALAARRLISPLLAAATKESADCIETNADSFRKLLSQTSAQNREFIVERVQALLAKSDDKSRPGVMKVADLLGVTTDLERAEQEAQAHIEAIEEARLQTDNTEKKTDKEP